MFSGQQKELLSRRILLVLGGLWLGIMLLPQVGFAATASELVAKAKEEGALNATVVSSMTGRTIPNLVAAFKKRFGLDTNVTIAAVTDVEHSPRAIAETRTGVAPAYDVMEGADV